MKRNCNFKLYQMFPMTIKGAQVFRIFPAGFGALLCTQCSGPLQRKKMQRKIFIMLTF